MKTAFKLIQNFIYLICFSVSFYLKNIISYIPAILITLLIFKLKIPEVTGYLLYAVKFLFAFMTIKLFDGQSFYKNILRDLSNDPARFFVTMICVIFTCVFLATINLIVSFIIPLLISVLVSALPSNIGLVLLDIFMIIFQVFSLAVSAFFLGLESFPAANLAFYDRFAWDAIIDAWDVFQKKRLTIVILISILLLLTDFNFDFKLMSLMKHTDLTHNLDSPKIESFNLNPFSIVSEYLKPYPLLSDFWRISKDVISSIFVCKIFWTLESKQTN
jgi:hypothetical protein